jgi:hypothetical protein
MNQPGGHTLIFTILIYLHILHKTLTDFEFGRNLDDEFHYLFECPSLSNERKKYFEPHFINRPNILKFCNLMNSKSVSVLCNMCKYIRIVNMRVCPPGFHSATYHASLALYWTKMIFYVFRTISVCMANLLIALNLKSLVLEHSRCQTCMISGGMKWCELLSAHVWFL